LANVLTVFAATTVPVPNAVVSAIGNTTGDSGGAISDSQGNYQISGWLGTDTYNVTAFATGFLDTTISNVAVTVGLTTSGQNILMPVSGGISGKVTDAKTNTPITAVTVFAESASGSGSYGDEGSTDSNGNYQMITDLATGQYNLNIFDLAGYMDQTKNLVPVTQGAMTSGVNFAMTESGSITGTVADSVSHAVQSGDSVYAENSTGATVATATTDSSGVYDLNTNLATGTYSVSVLDPTGHLPTTVSGIAVTLGAQTVQNIAINPSGIITGQVTAGGKGLAGADVSAESTDSLYSWYATTDSSGNYQINTNLATDTYTVTAYYGTAFNQYPSSVAVTAGSTTSGINIALTVPVTGSISGTVTSTTGGGVSDVYVDAVGTGFNEGSNYTESSGNYVITGLPADTYNVTATDVGYTSSYQYPVVVTANVATTGVNLKITPIASGVISGVVETQGTPLPEFKQESYMLVVLAVAMTAVFVAKLKMPKLKKSKPA
jgi:hypothetical protein